MEFFDSLILTLHNLNRWLVIIFAVFALYRAYTGWFQKRDWLRADNMAGMLFTSFLDLQVLLGLILYFLFSESTRLVFANAGVVLQTNPVAAFFGIEHVVAMIVAMAFAHAGRAIASRMTNIPGKHRTTAIWFSISILIILAAIPWPFLTYGRPLLRFFGITV
jgi:hypothetical protein